MERSVTLLMISLDLILIGVNRAVAGAPQSDNSLEARCPSIAAWQRAHPHPEPGQLYETGDQPVTEKALQTKLIDMYNADEEAGAAWGREIDKPHPSPKVMATLDSVRKSNLREIKSIIAKNGFPTTKQVGEAGVWAAFSLVQHADADRSFQKAVLRRIKPLYERKKVPGEGYAYLVDRVRVAEGRKQLFGTQFQLKGNELVIRPVEGPGELDARRQWAGLPSESDYLCYITFRSGKKARLQ